ncbi:HlyD family type I secretion periplasmic adaptor subunit [Terrihabitans soli]|uniref:Membrane fusion protein (MFP) family protein n=1 Tax=Terrihabitans soli TaxID=708113 RepID=A0A6S6QRE3_9HYPH|nr:HlyD family type I secretion periplasmic adaptor subunit [Terrihabitans soli]BCJ89621.1 HlyD family type I secretion periplasmic adaptor subunit [Terrihabitans soli]
MAPSPALRDIKRASMISVAAAAIFAVGAGAWGATVPIASAVIAPGQIVVESNVRRIQHPTGGVVSDILVKDGDKVQNGDVLVRLDDTTTRANLAVVENQLNQLVIREARLAAERDGAESFDFPEKLADKKDDPAVRKIETGERTLFTARRESMAGQKSQLRERVTQTNEEVRGLNAQADSKREQIRLIQYELEGVRKLQEQNLVPLSRVTALEREAARLLGEEGQHVAEIARAKGRIVETEIQIIQLEQEQRKEVAAQLTETEAKIADLAERRTAALDQLTRIDIRAPQAGVVHQKSVHTKGGVISAGEQIMLVVPQADGLVVDVRIEPQMIDRVHFGQSVTLKFPAFNSAAMPDIFGILSRVSADVTHDEKTGMSFYTARISIPPVEHAKLAGETLVPGMPVEAYIDTGSRTPFAYLTKPFTDQLARSFRY